MSATVYMIYDHSELNIKPYIGITKKTLEKRMNQHLSDYGKVLKGRTNYWTRACHIFKHSDDFNIYELETDVPVKDRFKYERRWIRETGSDCLNNQKEFEDKPERDGKKMTCECGMQIFSKEKKVHQKSKTHLKLMEKKKEVKD